MEGTVFLYFVGTAGSGKSTLTNAFSLWMQKEGYNAITLNLDPGVSDLPYVPDVDIRDWISLSEVMDEHKLGPNGAQVACADMIALNMDEVAKVLNEYRADYVLIDSPGQIELFAFRSSSNLIVQALSADSSVIVFLLDPILAKRPNGFASLQQLSATVRLRFLTPSINILSKSDLLTEDELERILRWAEDSNSLYDDLLLESQRMDAQLGAEFVRGLESLDTYLPIVPTSSETSSGLEDLYNYVQQLFFGGEDLTK